MNLLQKPIEAFLEWEALSLMHTYILVDLVMNNNNAKLVGKKICTTVLGFFFHSKQYNQVHYR